MSTLRDLPRTPVPERTSEDVFDDIFDLHAFGMAMKRHQFRRHNPSWSEAQLDAVMRDWLRSDPLPGQDEDGFRQVEGAEWRARFATP